MLIMNIAPHVQQSGATSPVRINLIKVDPYYSGCFLCGGDPLYRVTWDTPDAWWGDTHSEDYCHACVTDRGIREGWVHEAAPVAEPESVIICTHRLSAGRWQRTPAAAAALVRERMRLSRRSYDRGLAGDFRPARRGGPRGLLPLV